MAGINSVSLISEEAFGELRKNWGWLFALGILFIILGTVGLGMTFGLTLASMLFFGILMLIGGGAQLFQAFQCKGWKSIFWHILIALLYIAAGILIIMKPMLASAALTAMIAGVLIAVGAMRIVLAFQIRGTSGWWWALLAGIVSLVLGGIILAEWPVSGMWFIGLFIAIEMILNGWSTVFVALAAKNA